MMIYRHILLIVFIIQLNLYIYSSISLKTINVLIWPYELNNIKLVDKKKNLNTLKEKIHARDKLTIE